MQVRGLFVASKIAILTVLPVFGSFAGFVLAALLILSVVLSHAPSRVRYFVVLGGGQVRGASTKG